MIGNSRIAIPVKVIDAFKSWIGNRDADNAHFDEIFVHTLLLTLVTPAELVAGTIENDILAFVYGNNIAETIMTNDIKPKSHLQICFASGSAWTTTIVQLHSMVMLTD